MHKHCDLFLGFELLAFGIHWNGFVMFPLFILDIFMTDSNLISGYTISLKSLTDGGNGALNCNFLTNGQKFKNLSLPAEVPPMPCPTLPPPPPTHSQQCPSPWKVSSAWAATDGFPGWNNTWHTTPFVGL